MRTSAKLLFTIDEALDVVSVGRSKFYELLGTGAIESVLLGRRRLIPADALEDFVRRLRAGEIAACAAPKRNGGPATTPALRSLSSDSTASAKREHRRSG